MRPWPLVMVLLLAAAPSSAAPLGELTASRLQADGFARVEGESQRVLVEDAAPFGLQLEAAHLGGEVVEVHARGAVLAAVPDPPATIPVDLEAVQATVQSMAPHNLLVADGGSAQVQTVSLAAAPAAGQSAFADNVGPARSVPLQAGPGTLSVTATGSSIVVTGDFTLVLYGWVLDVQSATGASELRTGFERRQANEALESSPLTVGETWDRQAYLQVTGGRLELSGLTDGLGPLWMGATSLAVEGELVLEDPTGSVATSDGARELDVAAARLTGNLDAAVAREGGRLLAALSGDLDHAEGDGQPLSWFQQPEPARTPAWPFVVGAALALVAGLLLARSHLLVWAAQRMEAASDEGRSRAALRWARLLRRTRSFATDAAVTGVESSLQLKDLASASRWLEGAWARKSQPVHDFLGAKVRLAQGRTADAVHLLRASLRAEPGLAAQARADPAFKPLWAHPVLGRTAEAYA